MDIDENAPKYVLVDANKLVHFLEGFSCLRCVSTLQVSQMPSKGYANFFIVQCKDCDFNKTFDTSDRVSLSEDGSTRSSYDVNRRMVQRFPTIGKGHRGMESFSMSWNMKPMNRNAYRCHINNMYKRYVKTATESLEKARKEVCKAYTIINNTPLDEPGPINIFVSYDGSWQKRGFTSKNGVGCCIDVVTGLVIDYEVLSKYCKSCDAIKKNLGKGTINFRAWYRRHKPNCHGDGGCRTHLEAIRKAWI